MPITLHSYPNIATFKTVQRGEFQYLSPQVRNLSFSKMSFMYTLSRSGSNSDKKSRKKSSLLTQMLLEVEKAHVQEVNGHKFTHWQSSIL